MERPMEWLRVGGGGLASPAGGSFDRFSSLSGPTSESGSMSEPEPKRDGHWPTLVSAFLYFDASFMAWVLLGALGNTLSDAFGLTPGQKGLMVALPILVGAGLRVFVG